MNNKITIYELLVMVKDGKAPKEVKYCDEIFTFNNDDCNFLYKYQIGKCQLFGCCKLNDEVEILDNEDEKKIPEKIPEEIIVGKKQPTHRIKKIEKKINEIISYLDYLKSKGDE